MPRYKDSPEVRAAKQERREKLRELLCLVQADITRNRTVRSRDFSEIHSRLEIFFADRLPEQQKFTVM